MLKKTIFTLGLMSIVASGLLAESFTYKTYGGFSDAPGSFIGNPSDHYNSALDGPWWREGNFSDAGNIATNIPWGDQSSPNPPYNLKDMRSPHNAGTYPGKMWPAVSWGHPPRDPWALAAPFGGSSGIGVTGYGYPKGGSGHPITVGDSTTFAPLGSFTHVNGSLTFIGSAVRTIGWNVELYSGGVAILPEPRHYHFTLTQWETWARSTPCPRSQTGDINDTAWNDTHTPANFWDNSGKSGLGNIFVADGIIDGPEGCSDPFSFSYIPHGEGSDIKLEITPAGFLRDKFDYAGSTYEILYSGIYENNVGPGCTVTDYGRTANWDMACFNDPSPTLWSVEQQINVGYIRMQINKLDQGCTPGYWKQPQHLDDWTTPYNVNDSYAVIFGLDTTPAPAGVVNKYESYIGKNVYKKTVDESLKDDGIINLGEALWLEGNKKDANTDQYLQLIRTSTAALLNAANPEIDYLYSVGEIIAMVQDGFGSGDPVAIKDLFEKQNELGNNSVCE